MTSSEIVSLSPIERKGPMPGIIYLLRTREFVDKHEPTYKIGRSKSSIKSRMEGYPKQSEIHLVLPVEDHYEAEAKIKEMLKIKFVQRRREYGTEYFTGDLFSMVANITQVVQELRNQNRSRAQEASVKHSAQEDPLVDMPRSPQAAKPSASTLSLTLPRALQESSFVPKQSSSCGLSRPMIINVRTQIAQILHKSKDLGSGRWDYLCALCGEWCHGSNQSIHPYFCLSSDAPLSKEPKSGVYCCKACARHFENHQGWVTLLWVCGYKFTFLANRFLMID